MSSLRSLSKTLTKTTTRMSSTMRALVTIPSHKASVQSIPIPTPDPGEVLIKIHYAAQNPTDYKGIAAAPPDLIVGCDFAGTVSTIPSSTTTSLKQNQRVAGFVFGNSPLPKRRGAYAEYVTIDSSLVYPIPDTVSFQQAAVIPLAFATASQALHQRLGIPLPSNPVSPSESFPVLIHGGSSSVGSYAIQLAKLAGLKVITTASAKNHALCRDLGADVVIDYNGSDDNWPEQVRKITEDKLHHAFDCISEKHTTPLVAQAMSSTNGGHVICILPRKNSDLPEHLQGKVKIESTIVYTVFGRVFKEDSAYLGFDNSAAGEGRPEDKKHWEAVLRELPGLLADGRIKPNKVRELGGLDDVLEGFEMHRKGGVSAEKVVYKIAQE